MTKHASENQIVEILDEAKNLSGNFGLSVRRTCQEINISRTS